MKKIMYGLTLVSLLVSCSPGSKIIRSWKSSVRTKSYSNVVVMALTHDMQAKAIVENDLEAAFSKKGVITSKSMNIFTPNFSKDLGKEEMLLKIRHTNADAILTVSLINKETRTHYVPGYPGFVPGFWGYYSYWYPTFYTPGYYAHDRIYYIETNLYDVATDELIWTAQSKTYNPRSITGFSKNLASLLAGKLLKDDIIKPQAKH